LLWHLIGLDINPDFTVAIADRALTVIVAADAVSGPALAVDVPVAVAVGAGFGVKAVCHENP
jgi:hypothetical protein